MFPNQNGVRFGEESVDDDIPITLLPLSVIVDVVGFQRHWVNNCNALLMVHSAATMLHTPVWRELIVKWKMQCQSNEVVCPG